MTRKLRMSLFLWAALVLLVGNLAHSANPITTIVLRDNTVIVGVVVRTFNGGDLLIYTDKGPVRVNGREVKSNGVMNKSVGEINKLLGELELNYRARRYERIASDRPYLERAVEAYATSVHSEIAGSSTPESQRSAIKNSLAYFREKVAQIDPSLTVMRILDASAANVKTFSEPDKVWSADALDAIIDLQLKLKAATQVKTPDIQGEIEDVRKQVEHSVKTGIDAMQVIGLAHFRKDFRIDTLLRLQKGMRRVMSDIDQLDAVQLATVDTLLKQLSAERLAIPAAIDASVTFKDGLVVDPRPYIAITERLNGWDASLAQLKETLFGESAPLAQRLDAAIAANRDMLRASADRQRSFRELGVQLQKAAVAEGRQEWDAASELYRDAIQQYAALKLDIPGVEPVARLGLVRSSAQSQLVKLRQAPGMDLEQVNAVVKSAEAFEAESRKDFEAAGVDTAEWDTALKRQVNYRLFLERFLLVTKDMEKLPVPTWLRISAVDRMLEEFGDDVDPSAQTRWDAFLKANRQACFVRAVEAFRESPSSMRTEKDRELFNSFLDYYLNIKDFDSAVALLNRVLAKMREESPQDPYIVHILQEKLALARALAENGKHDQAVAVFSEIEAQYPAFARLHQNTLAAFLETRAKLYLQNNEIDAAIKLLSDICSSYSTYADARSLYVELIDLKVKRSGIDTSNLMDDTVIAYFEEACATYPGKLRNQAQVKGYGAMLLKQFDDTWTGGEAATALRDAATFAESYPNLARDTDLMDHVVLAVLQGGRQALLSKESGDTKVINSTVVDAMQALYQPAFKPFSAGPKLDELYVSLLLSRAQDFIDFHQYDKATKIYQTIANEFPALAEQKGLDQIRKAQDWRLLIGRFQQPMRIETGWDWGSLVAWVVIWLLLFVDAVRQGKRNGFMRYRLLQWTTVFGSFAVLMLALLFGSVSHGWATLGALVVPGVIFNIVGYTTYRFFPLVYAERRLAFERFLYNLVGGTGLSGPLGDDIERLELDMPLLHDRRLLLIDRARNVATSHPEKGYEAYGKVLHQLDQEIIKDEKWKSLHYECLLQQALCGAVGDHREASLDQLEEYLKFDPKNLQAQKILADEYYGRSDYERAIPHLKVCLTGAAQDDDLWFRLGLCFFETGRPVAAYKCLETTVEKSRETLFYMARAYSRAGNAAKAIKIFQKLLKDNAQDAEAIYYLSSTLATSGEDVKALKVMRLVPSDSNFYPQILALEGSLLLRNGKFDKARGSFMEAIQRDGTLVSAYMGLGQLLVEKGHDAQAMELFQKVCEMAPDHVAAHYFLGIIIEKTDPEKAVEYFIRSRSDERFKARASRRLGRLYFQGHDYRKAIEMFEAASVDYDRGAEIPPWFLYLHAFALARENSQDRCEQVLIKLLGQSTEDVSWIEQAPRAMYTIGITLFEMRNYRMAFQCFEYAHHHVTDLHLSQHLETILRETRFRLVVKLTEAGDTLEAQNQLLELQQESLSPERLQNCAYYTGLNQLYLEAFGAAREVFGHLYANNPQDFRAGYHLAAADLGDGHGDKADRILTKLEKEPNLPYHLQVGIATMRALMLAQRGDFAGAEMRLSNLPPSDENSPAAEYVKNKVSLARVYYLCYTGDSPRVQFLMAEMSDSVRGQAAYLQAVANLKSGRLVTVINNLHPYAHLSESNNRLFTALAVRQSLAMLDKDQPAEVGKILKLVPNPVQAIRDILGVFEHNALIDAVQLDDNESLHQYIDGLTTLATKTVDRLLQHTITHNQLILHLRRAIVVENSEENADADEIWQECLQTWNQGLFNNKGYWNLAQERLSSNEGAVKHFNAHEIEVINQRLKEECLLRTFRGFTVSYLRTGDFGDAKRHLGMIRTLGEDDGKLTVYMGAVLDEMEQVLRRIDRNDPVTNTWEFLITSLAMQLEIHEVLKTDATDLKVQLELYLKARERFASPSDFNKERRAFNTSFLEALQIGIKGNFVTAGDRIDKCLNSMPLGVNLGEVQHDLFQIREYCRDPERTEQQGIRLEREFEKLYQRIRNFDFNKGVVNATT